MPARRSLVPPREYTLLDHGRRIELALTNRRLRPSRPTPRRLMSTTGPQSRSRDRARPYRNKWPATSTSTRSGPEYAAPQHLVGLHLVGPTRLHHPLGGPNNNLSKGVSEGNVTDRIPRSMFRRVLLEARRRTLFCIARELCVFVLRIRLGLPVYMVYRSIL